MTILVVGAHCDDETLGCGATMAVHAQKGDDVFVLSLVGSPNRYLMSKGYRYHQKVINQVKSACQKAGKVLGVKKVFFGNLEDEELLSNLTATVGIVEEVVEQVRPDLIYTHHSGDVNQDHRGAFQACLVAARSFVKGAPRHLVSFEVPSATEQVFGLESWAFVPNFFVDVTKTLKKKIQAMRAYRTELREFPHPRSIQGIETLAAYRGMSVNLTAAEAFHVVKSIWYT